MLECVKNIVNTDVFDRFRFFDFFVNFEFPGFDFRCFLGAFWVLFGVLGTHLDDLRESLKQGGVWLARLAGQGDPNLRKHGKVMVDWRFLGVGNNQTSRVQATRLYTTSYQTVRIQDWKDYIDLQGAILITLPSTAWWPQGAGGFN